MAKKKKKFTTPAIRMLQGEKVSFITHSYDYEEKGGTALAAKALAVNEHIVVKTLVMMTKDQKAFIVLMHGDRKVSTKKLARQLGVKTVNQCPPNTAQRLTGYQVGGISPFGTRSKLPVYVEASILTLERMFINGGKRGLLIEIEPRAVEKLLNPVAIQSGI